jgi:hypothetical protein
VWERQGAEEVSVAVIADWESISRLYRAGVRSLRDIGSEFGVSEGAIRKRAKKEGWPRDLSEKIKARAEEKVRIDSVRNGTQGASEAQIVEANAAVQADIIIAHRTDVPRKRELVNKLFAEVEAITDEPALIEQLTTALGSGDMESLAAVARKVASLPARIKGVAELVSALKSLVELERKVFGIEGSGDGPTDTERAALHPALRAMIDYGKAK